VLRDIRLQRRTDSRTGAQAVRRDLSRDNIMRQATNLDMELPLLLPGGRVHTTPAERYPIKTGRMVRFEGDHWAVMRE
jgi:branched-chain amino acid transport system substrate-binding protein